MHLFDLELVRENKSLPVHWMGCWKNKNKQRYREQGREKKNKNADHYNPYVVQPLLWWCCFGVVLLGKLNTWPAPGPHYYHTIFTADHHFIDNLYNIWTLRTDRNTEVHEILKRNTEINKSVVRPYSFLSWSARVFLARTFFFLKK